MAVPSRLDAALSARSLHGIRDDWVGMADENHTDDIESPPEQPRRSVLSELPRGRPQRASRRREDARSRASGASAKAQQPAAKRAAGVSQKEQPVAKRAASGRSSKDQTAAKDTPRRSAKTAPRRGEPAEQAPRQGYEAEDQVSGTPVAPPSGIEIVGSLAELAVELAHTGIAAGGRLLKGALSRISDS